MGIQKLYLQLLMKALTHIHSNINILCISREKSLLFVGPVVASLPGIHCMWSAEFPVNGMAVNARALYNICPVWLPTLIPHLGTGCYTIKMKHCTDNVISIEIWPVVAATYYIVAGTGLGVFGLE